MISEITFPKQRCSLENSKQNKSSLEQRQNSDAEKRASEMKGNQSAEALSIVDS